MRDNVAPACRCRQQKSSPPCGYLWFSPAPNIANPVRRAVPGQPVFFDPIIPKRAPHAPSALVLEGGIVAGKTFSTEAALVILAEQHFFDPEGVFPVSGG